MLKLTDLEFEALEQAVILASEVWADQVNYPELGPEFLKQHRALQRAWRKVRWEYKLRGGKL